MTLRVVIAEDSLLMREGVRQVIDRNDDLEVVGDCADLPSLQRLVGEVAPDVVVTDVRMPPEFSDEGIRFAVALRESRPDVGVVVLSQYAEPAYANDLLGGGSARRAYLLKERVSQADQLAEAIRTVAQGRSVIDPSIVDLLVAASRKRPSSPLTALTPREMEVLDQVAQGKSNAGVAAALYLTERAVEKHINAMFAKLGLAATPDVNRRVTAVLLLLSERGQVAGPLGG
jgi:DNA-binding NarL/FixJ family response regulator